LAIHAHIPPPEAVTSTVPSVAAFETVLDVVEREKIQSMHYVEEAVMGISSLG
jgi:hypothetical protein